MAEEQKKKKEEEQAKDDDGRNASKALHWNDDDHDNADGEHEWKRSEGKDNKHNGAYGKGEEGRQEGEKEQCDGGTNKTAVISEYQKLRKIYSPEEITLLRHLQHESQYMQTLQQNDGRQASPIKKQAENRSIAIDVVDAMTPDNW